MEFCMLLRLVGLMNLIFISSHPINIQGRMYLGNFIKQKSWLVFGHLHTNFFKLGMVIDTAKLYSL